MNGEREEAIRKLRACSLQVSEPRIAVYQYLRSHRTHPTADAIYRALSPEYPALSKTTVYNTLKLFAAHNLALVLTIEEGELRFDADVSFHGHFKCHCCGGVFDVFGLENYPVPSVPDGFAVKSCQIDYYGLCRVCAAKERDA